MVLVDGIRKLVDCWWALKTLEKDSLLTLNTNVLWPLDEPGKVSSWLDITTDSEVSGTLLEQRILISAGSTLGCSSGHDHFLALSDFLWLNIRG